MRTFLFKLAITVGFFILLLGGWLTDSTSRANSNGQPNSHTGAPAFGTTPAEPNCTACHTGTVNSGDATVAVAATPLAYTPNEEVQIALSVNQLGRTRFGFLATALDSQGRKTGDLIAINSQRTQLSNVTTGTYAGRTYLSNTLAGGDAKGDNTISWVFKWKAPAQKAGRVDIWMAVVAADNNNLPTGDSVYLRTLSFDPAISPLITVSAASFLPNEAVAPESIVAGFSGSLANTTVAATTLPLPTDLGGLRATVKDSNGTDRLAPLFFVSPTQLNYLVPAGTTAGRAIITVRRGFEILAEGALNVEPVAPSLFSANATGQGVAVGVAVRVKADGQQSFEPVARLNAATNRYEALPLDLGPESEQLFLILFGTGFRNRTSLSDVACSIGGRSAEVSFAGAQGSLVGLDQANLRIPRTLIGRGNANVVCSVGGKTANTVMINIK
jgi:uncharacterized protein (TIGR03437 family)